MLVVLVNVSKYQITEYTSDKTADSLTNSVIMTYFRYPPFITITEYFDKIQIYKSCFVPTPNTIRMNHLSVLLVFGVVSCITDFKFKPSKRCSPWARYQPDPCTVCECTSLGTACWVPEYCSPPRCVDAVHHPDKCCPECPNGK